MFKSLSKRLFLPFALMSLTAFAAADDDLDETVFMPLEEVREGMIGEALSVVRGFDIESFPIEIIGVEEGGLPGSAMILARMGGPLMKQHGVVAGMSGSPVLIDGRIIGAVAYGYSFAYEPICGITPIEHMLTLWDELDAPTENQTGGGETPAASANVSAQGWDWQRDFEQYRTQGGDAAQQTLVLEPKSEGAIREFGSEPLPLIPLSAPLYLSGASPAVSERLERFLDGRGLRLMAAGSSAGSNETPAEPSPPIQAGSALGIPVMTGDLSLTGVGTVTWRKGNKLIAFGHPMMNRGASEIPMSQAYMFGFMRSYAVSFKLGETREIVGTVRQDRQYSIGGTFGNAPERLPVSVRVSGPAAANARSYSYSIWKDKDFLPILSAIALQQSFLASISSGGEMTADCRYVIGFNDGRTIEKTLIGSARGGGSFVFFLNLMQDMFLLLNNPFEQAEVQTLSIEIEARPKMRFDQLETAMPRYSVLEPGDTLDIRTQWQPYRAEPYDKRLELALEEDLEPGGYLAMLADAATAQRIDMLLDPTLFRPRNFEQTVEMAQKLNYPANRLTLYLFQPEVSMNLGKDSLAGLPDSIHAVIANSAPPELRSESMARPIERREIEFEYPITATAAFPLEIKRYIPE